MKKIIGFALCLSTLLLFGCVKQKETGILPKRTVISGKVQHMEIYPTTKELFAEVTDFSDRIGDFKGSINEDGSFKIVFDLYANQDIKIRPLIDKIILHPGDSIYIEIDFNDIGNVRFSGDRAETNRILSKYLWSNAGSVNFFTQDKLNMDAYKLYCDSMRADALEKQKRFIQEVNPPKEFIEWSSDLIKINYYKSLLSYPRNYFMRDDEGYNNWFYSTSYFDFTKNIEDDFNEFGNTIVNADIYEMLESYQSIVSMQLRDKRPGENRLSVNELIDEIINTHKDGVFKQLLLSNLSYSFLRSNQIKVFDTFKGVLDKNIKEPFIKLPLYDHYNNLKRNLENPKIASDAILSKMGVSGKELLDSIIVLNRGKVLFVDLWATWCGPCLEGMKASKEIMPQYKNKEIEFIFICVSSTEENWKTTLSRLQIGGKHYFCNQEQSGAIQRGLGVNGIPHYLIINKEGFIVEADCNGLEHQATRDQLEKLLTDK
jgi:thiol-disulfide isomerase/thioredoxin